MATKTTTKRTMKTEAVTKQSTALTVRETFDKVEERVRTLTTTGRLSLPRRYSSENAMKAAELAILDVRDKDGRAALEVASRTSIQTALLDMVIQGLNPSRDQCYFVLFGKTLTCMRSYKGAVALLRRVYGDATDVRAQVVYDGDDVEYDIIDGRKVITKHSQKMSNIDSDAIVGAYCVIDFAGGRPQHVEIMKIDQIRRAWAMGSAKGKSDAHEKFPEEMAKKTVINRACKILIAASDDRYLAEVVERQDVLVAEAQVNADEEEYAHREMITLADEDEAEDVEESARESSDDDAASTASAKQEDEPKKGPGF